jgi:hypothetical protein
MVIQPVVEGKGELSAVGQLLRRLMDLAERYDFKIARPIRQNSSQLLTPQGISRAVELARQTDNLAGILILFDGDIDLEREDGTYSCFCPKEDLAPLLTSARAAASPIPCEIVVPYKEFETWLLGGIEGLIAAGKIKPDSACPTNLEDIRGVKGRLSSLLLNGIYVPTAHQASLTSSFDMRLAYLRTRSFKKLMKVFAEFHAVAGRPLEDWPPPEWEEPV